MGYYINVVDGKVLNPHNKAAVLLSIPGARRVAPSEANVCVVENGHFDAAAFIFDEAERRAFNDPQDPRIKHWLYVPDASQMSGYDKYMQR